MHDIGKMGIPDSILLKQELLAAHQREVMPWHPDLASQLFSPIEFLRPALDAPYRRPEPIQ